jgi:hypothetical protein
MKRMQIAMASLVLALLVLSPALAAKKEKKNKPAALPGVAAAMGTLRGVTLTDEQKEQVKKIGESFNEKIVAVKAKLDAAEPAEVKKVRHEAMVKAKAEGKTGKELRAAVKAAGGELSKEQRQALKDIQQERQAVMKEMKDALLAVLTEDQRAALLAAKPMKKKKDK